MFMEVLRIRDEAKRGDMRDAIETACRICGFSGQMRRYRVREMMFGTREEFEYFMCSDCGCLQITEIPKDLGRFYPSGYYAHRDGATEKASSWFNRLLQKQRAKAAVFGRGYKLNRLLGRYVQYPGSLHRTGPILKKAGIRGFDASFLDVGCGAGSWWLEDLRSLGFSSLLGVDPLVPAVGRKIAIPILRQTIHGVPGSYSLITYHHSFEHIPDQYGEIEGIARHLKGDGVCLIRVPIVSSFAWECYGVDWVELDAPRHLYLHSRRSLELLGKKVGLELTDVVCDSTEFEFIGSEQYKRGIALHGAGSHYTDPGRSPFRSEEIAFFRREADRVNAEGCGGRAGFYFRKRSGVGGMARPERPRTVGREEGGVVDTVPGSNVPSDAEQCSPSGPNMCPNVAVVILNWNGRDDTLECLESVRGIDYPNFEVIVVDNGSSDDSVQAIRERFPEVTVIETGKNLGYAGGNNAGIREAIRCGAECVLVLNNDTVVDGNIIEAFLSAGSVLQGWGLLGAKVYSQAEQSTLQYAGSQEDREKGDFTYLGTGQTVDGTSYQEIRETPYVYGAAFMVRAKAALDVGLLDERYYLCYEETDWCNRMRKKGYKIYFVPKALVRHRGESPSFEGKQSPLRTYFMVRNRLLWAERHMPFRAWLKLVFRSLRFFLPYFGVRHVRNIRTAYWALLGWSRALRISVADPVERARRRAFRDYVFRRFGDCHGEIRRLNNLWTEQTAHGRKDAKTVAPVLAEGTRSA